MNWLDKLNLKPKEQKLLLIGVAVIFFVINLWYVWPHFGDWSKNLAKADEATLATRRYQNEVSNISKYKALIKQLEEGGAASIPSADQARYFQKTVQEVAAKSGVSINRFDPIAARKANNTLVAQSQTNSFFEEQGLTVTMQGVLEKDLVLFLYNLSTNKGNIRVKDLELNTDISQTKLNCKATLIASFQKSATAASKNPVASAASTAANRANPRTSTNAPARLGSAGATNNAAGTNTVATNQANITAAAGTTNAPAASEISTNTPPGGRSFNREDRGDRRNRGDRSNWGDDSNRPQRGDRMRGGFPGAPGEGGFNPQNNSSRPDFSNRSGRSDRFDRRGDRSGGRPDFNSNNQNNGGGNNAQPSQE